MQLGYMACCLLLQGPSRCWASTELPLLCSSASPAFPLPMLPPSGGAGAEAEMSGDERPSVQQQQQQASQAAGRRRGVCVAPLPAQAQAHGRSPRPARCCPLACVSAAKSCRRRC